jgi:hypothetical protein
LVHNEIDIIDSPGEIINKRRRVRIKAQEPEVTVALETGGTQKPQLFTIKVTGISILARQTRELAPSVIAPAVIHTPKEFGVTFTLGTDNRTTVTAGIKKAVDFTVLITAEYDRAASYISRLEISRVFKLRCMAYIYPALAKDAADFLRQDFIRHIRNAIQVENFSIRIVDDIRFHSHLILQCFSAPSKIGRCE